MSSLKLPKSRVCPAAALRIARLELENRLGVKIPAPGDLIPKQTESSTLSADGDEPVDKKKKSKKNKKSKKKGSSSSSKKKNVLSIHAPLAKPGKWYSRDVMKARTEWRHKKSHVYTYTPLPSSHKLHLKEVKSLSKDEKKKTISGHRFHSRQELETILEEGKFVLLERLPRVETSVKKKGQGPVEVVAVVPVVDRKSWSEVAAGANPKWKPAVSKEEEKMAAKLAMPAVPEEKEEVSATVIELALLKMVQAKEKVKSAVSEKKEEDKFAVAEEKEEDKPAVVEPVVSKVPEKKKPASFKRVSVKKPVAKQAKPEGSQKKVKQAEPEGPSKKAPDKLTMKKRL